MEHDDYSGGCQCGAVRFRVRGRLDDASICHCRMCQKAFGAYYAPLVSTRGAQLLWTRGAPLTYEAPDGVAVAVGAFDDPAALPPRIQYGLEARLPFVDGLHRLPAIRTESDLDAAPFLAQLVSHQHPDHDTERWPA